MGEETEKEGVITITPPPFPRDFPEWAGAFWGALFELYARHRALLRVLERHGIVAPERFEAEIESYLKDHAEQLRHEGQEWVMKFAAAYRRLHPPES